MKKVNRKVIGLIKKIEWKDGGLWLSIKVIDPSAYRPDPLPEGLEPKDVLLEAIKTGTLHGKKLRDVQKVRIKEDIQKWERYEYQKERWEKYKKAVEKLHLTSVELVYEEECE